MVLDDEDVQLAEALRELGLRKAESYLLTYLHLAGPSVSREVEMGTSLRQPEVSMAAKRLEEKELLDRYVSDERGGHRPMKTMEIQQDLSEVLDDLQREKEQEYRESLDLIQDARDLL